MPFHSHYPPRVLGFGLALIVLVLDQLHKWVMLEHTRVMQEAIEVTSFFKLVMVWNTGVSFGMFSQDSDTRRWVLIGITSLVVLALAVWLWRVRWRYTAVAIGLVIGGAVGNITDRVRFGAVADFFYFHYGDFFWPAFNIADSAIFVGVVLLLLEGWICKEPPATSDGLQDSR